MQFKHEAPAEEQHGAQNQTKVTDFSSDPQIMKAYFPELQ